MFSREYSNLCKYSHIYTLENIFGVIVSAAVFLRSALRKRSDTVHAAVIVRRVYEHGRGAAPGALSQYDSVSSLCGSGTKAGGIDVYAAGSAGADASPSHSSSTSVVCAPSAGGDRWISNA